jgi:hypothetical protein
LSGDQNQNSIPRMNRKALIAMWLTIALLAITWIAPPWLPQRYAPYKWGFLFDPVMVGQSIDYPRLLLTDALILAIGLGMVITLRKSNRAL